MVKEGDAALKLAGRDACHICAVVQILDANYVVIDGNVRKRKCNVKHLEFLGKNISIKKDAAKSEVLDGLKKLGLKFKEIKKSEKREKKVQTKTRLTKTKEKTEGKNK